MPEQHHHCKDGTKLDQDKKHILKRLACIKLQKLIHQQHMPGAAHRQPFRNPLHDAKENHLEQFYKIQHADPLIPKSYL